MNEKYRRISIVFELERAIKYLRLGLAEIQKISPENDFYDPIFIYLSGGLERLFKSMLCLNFLEIHGRLPNNNEVWKNSNGHDLLFLKSKVEQICIPIKKPFASMDYNVVVSSQFINKICKTLSEFGRGARYFNLDAILGIKQEYDSVNAWEKIESEVSMELYGKEEFYQLLEDPKQLNKIYSDSNKEIIIRLEIFFRALTRQFIFGNFSSESNTFVFQIDDFSDLDDDQLGVTEYGKYENHERITRKS